MSSGLENKGLRQGSAFFLPGPAFLLLRLPAGLPKSPLTEAAATQRRDAEAES
jgi:hypothetical protein